MKRLGPRDRRSGGFKGCLGPRDMSTSVVEKAWDDNVGLL